MKAALRVGAYEVHVRKYGDGQLQPTVLVHGLAMSGDYYIKYAETLAPYYDVHVIDLPGYGKTPKPPKALSIHQLGAVVSDYVKLQDLQNVVLVGQSMGGQIVAETALQQPERISKVMLLATTCNKYERNLLLQAVRLTQDFLKERFSANRIVLINYLRMGLPRYIQTSKYMIAYHLESKIKNIVAPVLVVNGSQDKISPKKWAECLVDAAPDGTLAVIDNAPHLLHYDKPDELVRITREFTQIP